MKKVLLLMFGLLAFYACSIVPRKLIIVNDSEYPIYYQLHTDTVPYSFTKYKIDEQFYLLQPHDTVRPSFVRGNDGTWAYKINRESTDSALHIFIFSTSQIIDKQIKNREFVRLSFTVRELDSLNWTVVYSGQKE